MIEEHKKDQKETWNIINKSLGKSKIRRIIQLRQDDRIIEDSEAIANILNHYFNNVGNIYGHVPSTKKEHLNFLRDTYDHTFHFHDITFEEVSNAISALNKNKATNDEVPIKVFRLVPNNIIKQLMII